MSASPGKLPDASPDPTVTSVPAASPVSPVDLSCLSCGYNLHDLRDDQTCPECGAAVAASRYRALADADPVWLGHLRRGLFWLVWPDLLRRGLDTVRDYGRPWTFRAPAIICELYELTFEVGFLLLVAALAAGAWWATMPEPGSIDRRADLYRRAARVTLLAFTAFLAVPLAQPLLARLGCWFDWWSQDASGRRALNALGLDTAWAAGHAALFLWLRTLARRAPAPRRAAACLAGVAAAAVEWPFTGLVMALVLLHQAGFDVHAFAFLVDLRLRPIQWVAALLQLVVVVLVYALISRAWRVARRHAPPTPSALREVAPTQAP